MSYSMLKSNKYIGLILGGEEELVPYFKICLQNNLD